MKNIIACSIFQKELTAIITRKVMLNIHWIDAALHANPDKMEKEISTVLSRIETNKDDIRLLFGNGCHPDMGVIAEKCGGAKLCDEKNCIQAFLGIERTQQLEKDRTMIISPGWLEAWQSIMDGFGWDKVDVRMNMGRYDRILLIDPKVSNITDEMIIEFFDLVQVPIETGEITLDTFKAYAEKAIGISL